MPKKRTKTPPKVAEAPVTTAPLLPGQWRPEVAFRAANMAEEVSDRLVSVLVLLDHLMDPGSHLPDDTGGYVLSDARDLVESCQRDLRKVVAENDVQDVGGAQ